MALHRGQEEALIAFLNDIWIGPERTVREVSGDRFAPLRDQILKAPPWKGVIGEPELFRLLWRQLYGTFEYLPPNFEGPLPSASDGGVLKSVAERVRLSLEALPSDYDVYIPMAGLRSIEQPRIDLTSNISIVDATHDESIRAAIHALGLPGGLLRALAGMDPVPPSVDSMRYLRIVCGGYGDWSPDSPAIRNALSIAKQFLFVGLGAGALVQGGYAFGSGVSLLSAPLVVLQKAGNKESFVSQVGFELSSFFHQIQFRSQLTVPVVGGASSLLSGMTRQAIGPDDLRVAIRSAMTTAIDFMMVNSSDAMAVRAAMEWYIDAEASQNESIAFLQRCIGLEALLGGGESRREVTERLADRYAYTVGHTESERRNCRDSFKSMYAHRSEIVHGRATQLSETHRVANSEARSMLRLAAWREMNSIVHAAKIRG